MKKVLFVCDANNFSAGAFEFINSLHRSEDFLLTGAFFHSINYDELMPATLSFNPDPLLAFTDADVEAVASSIQLFKKKCLQNSIEFKVHEESEEFRIEDVIKETRFADFVVISEELFCSHLDNRQPNKYLQEVMQKSECPLMVVPENFTPITNIIIAYDGKRESVYAMKQFTYLFEDLCNLPTTVLFVQHQDSDEIPNISFLEEYAGRHFQSLNIQKVRFLKKDYLPEFLSHKKDSLLIAGAYSHPGFWAALRQSFVEKTIRDHQVPVFIAHHV